MRIYQTLGVAAAGAALSLVVSEAAPAQAATMTYDFTLTLTSGSGALQSSVGNEYNGFFSYDDSQIVFSAPIFGGLGYITFPTEFSLNFNNINYTVTDLFQYRRGAGGTLLQFTPSGNSFQLNTFGLAAKDPGSTTSSFNLNIFQSFAFGFNGFIYIGDDGQGSGSVASALRPQAVPESDTVLGISVLGFLGWFLKKKKASSKRA